MALLGLVRPTRELVLRFYTISNDGVVGEGFDVCIFLIRGNLGSYPKAVNLNGPIKEATNAESRDENKQ